MEPNSTAKFRVVLFDMSEFSPFGWFKVIRLQKASCTAFCGDTLGHANVYLGLEFFYWEIGFLTFPDHILIVIIMQYWFHYLQLNYIFYWQSYQK